MDLGLKGRVVIVTGGAMGIGKGIAEGFVSEGANVVIADLKIDEAGKVAKDLSKQETRVMAIKCDVTQKSDAENLAEQVFGKFGRIDVLVNNAGMGICKSFIDFSEEDYYKLFEINVKGIFLMTVPVLKHMIPKKWGKIVNISSQVGKMGFPGNSIYSASKFAVIGITQSLAKEMGEHNINVNAVCPGIVPTQFFVENAPGLSKGLGCAPTCEAVVDTLATQLMVLKRPEMPSDIANAVLFLSSDVSKEFTGQAVNVTGGSVMH